MQSVCVIAKTVWFFTCLCLAEVTGLSYRLDNVIVHVGTTNLRDSRELVSLTLYQEIQI